MFFGFEKFRLFDALFATFTVKQNIKLANIWTEITFLLIYLLPVYWRVRDMGGGLRNVLISRGACRAEAKSGFEVFKLLNLCVAYLSVQKSE